MDENKLLNIYKRLLQKQEFKNLNDAQLLNVNEITFVGDEDNMILCTYIIRLFFNPGFRYIFREYLLADKVVVDFVSKCIDEFIIKYDKSILNPEELREFLTLTPPQPGDLKKVLQYKTLMNIFEPLIRTNKELLAKIDFHISGGFGTALMEIESRFMKENTIAAHNYDTNISISQTNYVTFLCELYANANGRYANDPVESEVYKITDCETTRENFKKTKGLDDDFKVFYLHDGFKGELTKKHIREMKNYVL